jgi:hypothetical protein
MSPYRLDRVLLVITTCKFYRGCSMHFGGSLTKSGRDSGFIISITHGNIHLLCSNSSPRKPFPSSPSHSTLRVTFSCSLFRKWVSWGHVSQTSMSSNRKLWPNCRRFPVKPSALVSNSGRTDGASMCVLRGSALNVIMYALPCSLSLRCNINIPGTLRLPMTYKHNFCLVV